jgi:hypothetical protein
MESERADALAAAARAMPTSDFGFSPTPLVRSDVPHLSESVAIRIESAEFVESPGVNIFPKTAHKCL